MAISHRDHQSSSWVVAYHHSRPSSSMMSMITFPHYISSCLALPSTTSQDLHDFSWLAWHLNHPEQQHDDQTTNISRLRSMEGVFTPSHAAYTFSLWL